jgi:hypothetical protein
MGGLRIFSVAVEPTPCVTHSGPGKGRGKARIALDGLLEQVERLGHLLSPKPRKIRQGAQVQIVGGEIIRPPFRRAKDLGGLQRRLDDTSGARRNLVLKLEDIFKRTFEAIGPEMRAGESIDQLRGNAHLPSRLPRRALQNISDAEFPPNLLHIDGLALGEARIAGDDKKPADA